MRKIGTFDLQVSDGETIALRWVASQGTKDPVTYALNGKDEPSLVQKKPYERTLTLTGPDKVPNPSYLATTKVFAVDSGGSFTIEVTGNRGGDLSRFDYEQGDNETYKTLTYKFTIV